MQVDGLDGGADVVEAVGAPADDLQVEVELGARREGEGQPVDLGSNSTGPYNPKLVSSSSRLVITRG